MARREKSKALLLDAAAAILAADRGVSLSEIARRAGVGRATAYRHFPSREDLLRALALRSIEEIDDATTDLMVQAPSAKEAFRRMMEAIIPLGDRYHFLSQEWETLNDPAVKRRLDLQLQGLNDLVEAMKAEGSIASDVPTAWVVASIDTMIYAAWTSVRDGWIARRQAADLAVRTLFNGLSA